MRITVSGSAAACTRAATLAVSPNYVARMRRDNVHGRHTVPSRDALTKQGLAFAPEDTATEQLAKVEIRLGALASTENVALIADFLGLPPSTKLQLSSELRRRKTIDLLVQSTLSLRAAQPLVVFVEDLHWCDASTLELLGHLIAQSPTARVLVLATARPEFKPPWPARSNLTTVQLARLTKRQARDMIAALAGTDLSAATLDALVIRADGVPLYVEELTKVIAEPGAARGVEAIPASLADSLMGRLTPTNSSGGRRHKNTRRI